MKCQCVHQDTGLCMTCFKYEQEIEQLKSESAYCITCPSCGKTTGPRFESENTYLKSQLLRMELALKNLYSELVESNSPRCDEWSTPALIIKRALADTPSPLTSILKVKEALESGQEIIFEGCPHIALNKDLVEEALDQLQKDFPNAK